MGQRGVGDGALLLGQFRQKRLFSSQLSKSTVAEDKDAVRPSPVGCGKRGGPWKSLQRISRELWGPARGFSEVAPRLFGVGLQLANLEIAEAALTAVIGEHEAGS